MKKQTEKEKIEGERNEERNERESRKEKGKRIEGNHKYKKLLRKGEIKEE